MPSWITHLVTADKVYDRLNIKDKNSFLLGNIMPDILNGYIIPNTSIHLKYEVTHFSNVAYINEVAHNLPNLDYFLQQYKSKLKNPLVCGYFTHLLTDYFWNTISYTRYFTKHNELVSLKLLHGKSKDYEYDEAIKIKQSDFRIFAEYLKEHYPVQNITCTDEILKLNKDIAKIPLAKQDINCTIEKVEEYIKGKDTILNGKYEMFTQEEMIDEFNNSIKFISEKFD